MRKGRRFARGEKPLSAGFLGRIGDGRLDIGEVRLAEGMRPAEDAEAADWLSSRLLPWGTGPGSRVGAVIPTGFEAYARVFHPAMGGDDTTREVSWKEVAAWSGRTIHEQMQWEQITDPLGSTTDPRPWTQAPAPGEVPLEIRRRLVSVLKEETMRPDLCWVLVWTGWGGFEPDLSFPSAPEIGLPGRDYLLFRGPLERLGQELICGPGPGELAGPSIWWPEDQRWCVATEVDFCWTYVAGSRGCISKVLSTPGLEALETRPEHRGDYTSDTVNGS